MKNFKMIMSVTMLLSMSGVCLNASDKGKKLSVQDQRVVDGLRSTIKVASKKAELLDSQKKEIPAALAKEYQMARNSLVAMEKKTGLKIDAGIKEGLINKNLVKKADTLPAMPAKTGTMPKSTRTGTMPKTAEMENLTPQQDLTDDQKALLAKMGEQLKLIKDACDKERKDIESIKVLASIDLSDAADKTLVNANYAKAKDLMIKVDQDMMNYISPLEQDQNSMSNDLLGALQQGDSTNAIQRALNQMRETRVKSTQFVKDLETEFAAARALYQNLQNANNRLNSGTVTAP